MVSEWKNSALLKQLEKVLIDKKDIFFETIAAFAAFLTDPDTAQAGNPYACLIYSYWLKIK